MSWLHRRASILGVTSLGVVVVATTTAPMSPTATIPLYQDGVQVTAAGELTEVPAGRPVDYHPGSRVPSTQTDAASLDIVAEHRTWLASGRVCGTGEDADAVADALLDLHVLTASRLPRSPAHAEGALVAGWEPRWRYVWPRDTSFAAAALATAGHEQDAVAALEYLASLQQADGTFSARYLPTGEGVPDGRADQLDGAGWVLWASSVVLERTGSNDDAANGVAAKGGAANDGAIFGAAPDDAPLTPDAAAARLARSRPARPRRCSPRPTPPPSSPRRRPTTGRCTRAS